ncbi:MAG: hypothetical protein QOD36_535 [Mycobacterium sp.]|nr:hypothetical protein [Mycobacterium sp.]
MGKHSKPRRSWGPYVTTGIALEAVAICGFAYATDSHVSPPNLLAATIFVDGTKSVTGTEEGVPFFRMADSFQGVYDAGPDNVFIEYPRSLGPITGAGDPTYDDSEGDATTKIVAAVRAARQDDATGKIYVVGYSQGSGAAVKAIDELESDPEFNTDNIEFVLAANPRRNDGGILTRLPKGVYLPVFGVTFGDGTTPEGTKVLQVTKAYDGVADSPAYIFNIASDLNAALGFYYLHPGYYKNVDPDPNDPTAIVTTSADGNITDKLIPAPLGQLPLTMPLLALGLPPSLVTAMDPFLRSVIETGYNRPDPNVAGSYPSEPVPFQLVPPPQRWLPDVLSVAAGAAQSVQLLTGALQPNSLVNNNVSTLAARQPETPAVAQAAPPGDDKPAVEEKKSELVADKPPATGTGPNKVEPVPKAKTGWRPGDLLQSLFTPKPKPVTEPHGSTPAADPKPSTPAAVPKPSSDDHEPASDAESGSAA